MKQPCLLTMNFVSMFLSFSFVNGQDTSSSAQVIVPAGQIEKVQGDFAFTEGPAWDENSRSLYFTDIPKHTIHKLDIDGNISVFTDDSKHSNGLYFTGDGRMLGCQMDGQVVQYDLKNAQAKVLASEFNGSRFNAPNDLVVDSRDGVYFTDPLYRAPEPLPQQVQTVYYIAPNGKVSRVTDHINAPNGIGLSPDGRKLYVCPSKQAEMLVFDVKSDGMLSESRVFYKVTQPSGKSNTGSDGIALDVEGNVYLTTHLGVEIVSPEGKQLGLIEFPEHPANVTFGGENRKTMFVTARTSLYKVEMPIAGLKPF